jgi:biopolymer transport protein ExbB
MNTMDTLQDYWEVAGPTLVFMLAVSMATVAIALERWWMLIRARGAVTRSDERVLEAARRGDLEESRRLADNLASPFREVFAAGLDRALGRVRGEPGTAMAREAKRTAAKLRAGLWMLGSVGALMPFAGLLGTVVGVMSSFKAIGTSGQGGFSVVSAGISEALIATAAGLFVAIEAVLFFNLLGQKATGVARDLNLLVDEMGELVRTRKGDAERPSSGN